LCLSAVKNKRVALKYVPESMKTREICEIATNLNGFLDSHVFQYIPDTMKTPEMCLKAVCNDGYALEFIPKTLITDDIIIAALFKNNPYIVKYIPDLEAFKARYNKIHGNSLQENA
jgi:hypothetical protein